MSGFEQEECRFSNKSDRRITAVGRELG